MGGAPRNPAPRNHLLVWIVKSSGCHCTNGHLTSRAFTEDGSKDIVECRPPLRSTSPFSDGRLRALGAPQPLMGLDLTELATLTWSGSIFVATCMCYVVLFVYLLILSFNLVYCLFGQAALWPGAERERDFRFLHL